MVETGQPAPFDPDHADAAAVTAPPGALDAQGLVKRFGAKVAVDGVELTVPQGSLFGLVGPNGAGKTTLLRLCTGLLRPDAGRVHVDGVDVWTDPLRAKRRVGILPEDLQLFDRLTGRQLLTYTGLLRGMEAGVVAARVDELAEVLDLTDALDVLVIDYSQGMRKKAGLACALLHAPRLLFLDEPFESLDPLSARTIRALLRRHITAGGTVVLSSHVMEVVERLCDHVAVIHSGRIVATGPLEQVQAGQPLEERFVELVGGGADRGEGLEWLGTSSD